MYLHHGYLIEGTGAWKLGTRFEELVKILLTVLKNTSYHTTYKLYEKKNRGHNVA